jgi:uncharacterized membrane protein
MSFETGKKLCIISSLITIISPIVIWVAYLSLFAQLFSSVLSTSDVVPPILPLMYGIPAVVVSLSVVGLVLFLVGMYYLSKYYNTPGIFKNVFKAFLINIATSVVVLIVVFLLSFVMLGSSIIETVPTETLPILGVLLNFLIAVIVLALVAYAIAIYCAILYKRSFDALAEKSGVGEFKTMGLLYLIGTILPIGIITLIGWIFAALGYNKLKAAPPPTETYSPPQTAQATKTCSHCGAENVVDANYCCGCGSQIP